jgi:hypothetical protein
MSFAGVAEYPSAATIRAFAGPLLARRERRKRLGSDSRDRADADGLLMAVATSAGDAPSRGRVGAKP